MYLPSVVGDMLKEVKVQLLCCFEQWGKKFSVHFEHVLADIGFAQCQFTGFPIHTCLKFWRYFPVSTVAIPAYLH